MQSTAQGFLVYQLTQSAAYLGYVGFASGLPSWLFTLYGGVIADRLPRRTLLVITQTSMMLLAFILAALTSTSLIQPWEIIFMAFLLGIANAFDAPARQSFVLEMVDREDMTNAIALNSTMFNTATVVGPAVAGFSYALLGPAWCFSINGFSFIAVIIALLLMNIRPLPKKEFNTSMTRDLIAGLTYVKSHDIIRMLITNIGIISLFGLGMMTLMPAWSVDILRGNAQTNGWLLSSRGAGALIGALMIAALGRKNIKGKLWTIGSFALPGIMLIFASVHWLPFSMAALVGCGWGFMTLANTTNAMVQTYVNDELRGRVMGIYTLIFFGAMPLGSLLAGIMASWIGEPMTIALNALVLLAFAMLIWLFKPNMRKLE
jgi:MFS family permease